MKHTMMFKRSKIQTTKRFIAPKENPFSRSAVLEPLRGYRCKSVFICTFNMCWHIDVRIVRFPTVNDFFTNPPSLADLHETHHAVQGAKHPDSKKFYCSKGSTILALSCGRLNVTPSLNVGKLAHLQPCDKLLNLLQEYFLLRDEFIGVSYSLPLFLSLFLFTCILNPNKKLDTADAFHEIDKFYSANSVWRILNAVVVYKGITTISPRHFHFQKYSAYVRWRRWYGYQ